MTRFSKMAYHSSEDMVFGRAKKPVSYGLGIKTGFGKVIPEINYIPRSSSEHSEEKLLKEYVKYIAHDTITRAINLGFPDLQLETEWLASMTDNLSLSSAIVSGQKEVLENLHSQYGINLAIRHTIPDIRNSEFGLRNKMDSKKRPENIIECAEIACESGADVLSIESLGGKELTDYAIVSGDVTAFLFGAGILAQNDKKLLWDQLVPICKKHKVIPGGDTGCACSNTAMFMAGGQLDNDVQRTFSAVTRCITAAGTLATYESGATGPDKDCAYEGPILKAITGMPISQEGKHSHCAHIDLQGNLMAAVTDLWSNESVQYRPEFGGSSIQCWMGMIGYECSLMNTALATGKETILRDLYTLSDKGRSPEGYLLAFDNAWEIGKTILDDIKNPYLRARNAGLKGAKLLIDGYGKNAIRLSRKQLETLYRIIRDLESLPDDQDQFIELCLQRYSKDSGFKAENYELFASR